MHEEGINFFFYWEEGVWVPMKEFVIIYFLKLGLHSLLKDQEGLVIDFFFSVNKFTLTSVKYLLLKLIMPIDSIPLFKNKRREWVEWMIDFFYIYIYIYIFYIFSLQYFKNISFKWIMLINPYNFFTIHFLFYLNEFLVIFL